MSSFTLWISVRLEATVPADILDITEKVREAVGRDEDGAGVGFGQRDVDFGGFTTYEEAEEAGKRVVEAFGEGNAEFHVSNDEED